MSEPPVENSKDLLARLSGKNTGENDGASWAAVAATRPAHETNEADSDNRPTDQKLDGLIDRINSMAGKTGMTMPSQAAKPETIRQPSSANIEHSKSTAAAPPSTIAATEDFIPIEPTSFKEAGLTDTEVETLVVKYLLAWGEATGRAIAEQVRLPFILIERLLHQLKAEQVLAFKDAAQLNDYVYLLTDLGRERGHRYIQTCTYFGSAPVSLEEYAASVRDQSLEYQSPTPEDLSRAFSDLLINKRMLSRLGPAINSGRGLFLYGSPGNGKTSIAERVTSAFGDCIWIPRAIGLEGEIIRVFDPNHHIEAALVKEEGLLSTKCVDARWIRVRRPTIVVGGELTMENLEVTIKPNTGTCEAPLQLKANCGTLLIDDFGRQRMSIDELLNRWIVPLEKRYDFLNLPNGKKIKVPFDELIIFATNLKPKDLVDEAFLRRIPYKVEVTDPTQDEFCKLFEIMCPKMGFEYDPAAVNHLVEKHYLATNRPYRCCQPRDLLLQIRNLCDYHQRELKLTPEYFDFAVENYFAAM